MAGGMTDAASTPQLDLYKRLFQEAQDMSQTTRERAKRARRYYDGKIDEKLEKTLKGKRQPTFVINRVRPGVEGMVGVVDRGKSDPRAYPRNPQDEASSEVATDTLRYVSDINRWHRLKIDAFRNELIEGTAAVLTEVGEDLEVRFRRIRYEEFFADPYSRELDFSDAGYMGVAKWTYIDAIVAMYPEHEAQLRDAVSGVTAADSTWEDRPTDNGTTWVDSKRKRLLLVEMYYRYGGQWLKCVFVGDTKLEEGESPYLDQDGKPCNPIEAVSAYIDDENRRYGVVADMEGPQDEINVYRRKAAHLATFRQFQETGPEAASADKEEVRAEGAKADGVIPPGYAAVANDKFAMDMALLQEAKAEIERVGPSPEVLGRQSASASGRAQLIRQQAGLTELSHLFSGLEDFELRVMRQAWARVRQFWREPKFIRVTDDENAFKFVQINKPVWGPPAPVIDPLTGVPKFDPVTRQVVMEPQFQGMENDVAQMDVDIIIDTTPDTANVQQEQFQGLVELAQAGAFNPGNPAGAILIRASSLPKKRELLDQLEQMQANQQPDPRAEEAFRLEAAEKAAGIDKTAAQADEARANALKTMGEARNDELQTRFMVAAPPGSQPPPGF